MATYAIGDIHGNLKCLNSILENTNPGRNDTVVFLGDYIDRGLDSKPVIDEIIALKDKTNVISLRGNHEIMMVLSRNDYDCYNQWMGYGGFNTVASYETNFQFEGWHKYIPTSHWQFLYNTLPYYETEDFIFVHAAVEHDKDLNDQTEEWLYWRSFSEIKAHKSGKTVICGHSSNKQGLIQDAGHAICIDTWPVMKWLTCLNVDTLEYLQASEDGHLQSGQLR